jgi:excisionase family DNA binding protein
MPRTQSLQNSEAPPAVAAKVMTVRVPEACRLTGIGRSKLYELIKDGKIRTVKVGAITLIPVRSLADFLGLELLD